jgi:alpha-beta hydrolase superfamily lysophospholipase
MLSFIKNYIENNLKNIPFIIMGHSMGGGITLATFPEYKSQIKAIILECPLTPAISNRSEEEGKFKVGSLFDNFEKSKQIILQG